MLAMSVMLLALGAAQGQMTAGPTVGLIDTGVRASHVDLRGIVQSGYNAIDGSTDTRDLVGHGTHVAGTLATDAGIGSSLTILPVQIFSNAGGATDASLSAGLNWASSRAGILNLSLSAGAPVAGAAIRDAVAKGALVVVAAGNRGASQPVSSLSAQEIWAASTLASAPDSM